MTVFTNKIASVLILLLFSLALMGQEVLKLEDIGLEDERKAGSLYLVPEASLWLGSYTNVHLSPQLGYHLTEKLSIGAGPYYTFYALNQYYTVEPYSTHIYGAKVFSRFNAFENISENLPIYLFDDLFLYAEYEFLSLENKLLKLPTLSEDGRFYEDYFYAGFGISQNYSQRSSYFLAVLWQMNQSSVVFQSNPTYRLGAVIYFKDRKKSY